MSLENNSQTNPLVIILIIITLLLASLVLYLFVANSKKTNEILILQIDKKQLEAKLAFNKETSDIEIQKLNADIIELNQTLLSTREELEDIEKDFKREKNINRDFENQINSLSGVVKDLDKLTKTDKELLQKYSKTYFLNENFVPSKIKQINDKYILSEKKDQYFHSDALPFLEDLLDDAKKAGYDLKIVSAYRSFDEQNELKGQFTQVYGDGANTFSADQGYSEHQLGTTVDLTDTQANSTNQAFAESEAYQWLLKNAYRYGFILSYPEGNNFYIFEPWHWRFVGIDLARDLHRQKAQFYEWEQRRIDEYLIKIFD